MKLLVYAYREWSYLNLLPALEGIPHKRWFSEANENINPLDYDLIITCEPHIDGWRKFYPKIKGKVPVLALQQGMYYAPPDMPVNKKAAWLFDKYMVWGEQMRESCLHHKLSDDRIIVTGNPKHDAIFNCKPEKGKDIIVLLDGVKNHFTPAYQTKYKTIPHPNKFNHTIRYDTFNLIRKAELVAFQFTGCGVWALIMGKRCHVYKKWRKDCLEDKYLSLEGVNYGKHIEVTDAKKYVKWAVGDNQATKRVANIIKEYM